jgi:hypothetical protein
MLNAFDWLALRCVIGALRLMRADWKWPFPFASQSH